MDAYTFWLGLAFLYLCWHAVDVWFRRPQISCDKACCNV